MRTLPSHRPGVTFIELLLFIAILAMSSVMMLPLLFSGTENRLLQETISLVEHNGTQILQTLGQQVRHAERVIDPSLGGAKTVLALQTSSGATSPTIFGVSSGSFMMIQHTARQVISSPQVAVENFRVTNTSQSGSRQSVKVSFRISRSIRLAATRSYVQDFEALYTLYPRDRPTGGACGTGACGLPGCSDSTHYAWQVCEAGACLTATDGMVCN
ncbi:MAG: Uncharacterized protein Greene041619_123 [Candidatus Peregrinibacteria bacterium Greene0416_19]|nr:MAG: Uncharacterized protein Greene041619_123 [Candidatus Peregrinibacteria bacterium Greene0416_19]